MKNLVAQILLPKGLALKSGAFLDDDVVYEVISEVSPYYASVEQVRLEGGQYLSKLSDITLGAMIYQMSKRVDQLAPPELMPPTGAPSMRQGNLVHRSRNIWVIAKSVETLLDNMAGLLGNASQHVLANLSISRSRGNHTADLTVKFNELAKTIKEHEITLRSWGRVMPGGRAKAGFAAKQLAELEKITSRTWQTTGMGANAVSAEMGVGTEGRGKAVRMYASPLINIMRGRQSFGWSRFGYSGSGFILPSLVY